jgi:hypothetical protein
MAHFQGKFSKMVFFHGKVFFTNGNITSASMISIPMLSRNFFAPYLGQNYTAALGKAYEVEIYMTISNSAVWGNPCAF